MRKAIPIILSVLAGMFVLQGCETIKGITKDVNNTATNIGKLINSTREQDDSFKGTSW